MCQSSCLLVCFTSGTLRSLCLFGFPSGTPLGLARLACGLLVHSPSCQFFVSVKDGGGVAPGGWVRRERAGLVAWMVLVQGGAVTRSEAARRMVAMILFRRDIEPQGSRPYGITDHGGQNPLRGTAWAARGSHPASLVAPPLEGQLGSADETLIDKSHSWRVSPIPPPSILVSKYRETK